MSATDLRLVQTEDGNEEQLPTWMKAAVDRVMARSEDWEDTIRAIEREISSYGYAANRAKRIISSSYETPKAKGIAMRCYARARAPQYPLLEEAAVCVLELAEARREMNDLIITAAKHCNLDDRKTAELVNLLERILDAAEKMAATPKPALSVVPGARPAS